MKLLDTNALIRHFQDSNGVVLPDEYAISRITYVEFLSFRDMVEEEVNGYIEVLENAFRIIELDSTLASSAAALRRRLAIPLGDSIILATALDYDLKLVTSDKRLKRKYDKLITLKYI
ncbi:PIN domain-containing protein [Candidatus Dojkabacteria bacterium]|nr:PIN domain-containing protein [Candidatus Dojkabacteria bacterium]